MSNAHMRRDIITALTVVCCLASCSPARPEEPSEVIAKAARMSQKLESATVTIVGALRSGPATNSIGGTLKMEGVLQSGGKQIELALTIKGKTIPEGEDSTVSANIIVLSEEEVFAKIEEVTGADPLLGSESLRAMKGQWYVLPSASGSMRQDLTPDPQIIKFQAEVVRVTADRGTETLHGRTMHHYNVEIDPEKLERFLATVAEAKKQKFEQREMVQEFFTKADVKGELWIDTETYFIHQISWTMNPAANEEQPNATIAIEINDHNAAKNILPPKNAIPLPLDAWTMGIQRDALIDGAPDARLPAELENQLMESIYLDR